MKSLSCAFRSLAVRPNTKVLLLLFVQDNSVRRAAAVYSMTHEPVHSLLIYRKPTTAAGSRRACALDIWFIFHLYCVEKDNLDLAAALLYPARTFFPCLYLVGARGCNKCDGTEFTLALALSLIGQINLNGEHFLGVLSVRWHVCQPLQLRGAATIVMQGTHIS
jgi:hypothetical protein